MTLKPAPIEEHGKGVEYVKKHFGGYPTIVIDANSGEKNVLC